ncbi:barrier-to-autointegration factor-like [Crassostrea virginica]
MKAFHLCMGVARTLISGNTGIHQYSFRGTKNVTNKVMRTRKRELFAREPLGEKSVQQMAGIGKQQAEKLKDEGYEKAYQILGMFLQCNKEEEKFKSWLKTTCGANKKQQSDCFLCLQEWCNNHPL